MKEVYVTAAVLCYNSSGTVLETLDSIRDQTFRNLDLVINDDGSTDDSVTLIQEWLNANRNRFRNVLFNKNKINLGINKSFDYAMKNSGNEWCKVIAADDILTPNCIKDNMEFIRQNLVNTIVYSYSIPFSITDSKVVYKKIDYSERKYLRDIGRLSAIKQFAKLLRRDIMFSPTGFINTYKYLELGGLNTDIRNIEDWPLRLMFTKNDSKIYVLEKETVLYRIGDSVSNTSKYFYNINHLEQRNYVKRLLVYPNISKWHVLYYANEYLTRIKELIIIKILHNKKNLASKIVNLFFGVLDTKRWKRLIYIFYREENNT